MLSLTVTCHIATVLAPTRLLQVSHPLLQEGRGFCFSHDWLSLMMQDLNSFRLEKDLMMGQLGLLAEITHFSPNG